VSQDGQVRATDLQLLTWMRGMPASERRLLRECANISRVELAAAVGVSRAGLTKWELDTSCSRTPSGQPALRYARLLARLSGRQDVPT